MPAGSGWFGGRLTPLTRIEEDTLDPHDRSLGVRLACQAAPLSDVKIDIPPESLTTPQRLQIEGQERARDPAWLDPAVTAREVSLPPPSLADLRADTVRLAETLAQAGISPLEISLPALADFPERLRGLGWNVRLAIRRPAARDLPAALVSVLPPGTPLLGLAVDMGSTKLAVYLVDLESGATLAQPGVMNPQIAYGEDVVSRIAFANRVEENRLLLQTRLVETLQPAPELTCCAAARVLAAPRWWTRWWWATPPCTISSPACRSGTAGAAPYVPGR